MADIENEEKLLSRDLMIVTQFMVSLSYIEQGLNGYTDSLLRRDDRTASFMRYALFGAIHRIKRFCKDAIRAGLLTSSDVERFEDFLVRSSEVRNAFEHFEDTIMDRPKGEKHKTIRLVDGAGLDATSEIRRGTGATFGNLVTTEEIGQEQVELSLLNEKMLAVFKSKYGFVPNANR